MQQIIQSVLLIFISAERMVRLQVNPRQAIFFHNAKNVIQVFPGIGYARNKRETNDHLRMFRSQ